MYRVTLYPTTDTQYLAAVNHGGLCCPEQLDMPINYAEPATEISDGNWTANTMRESDTAIGGNETYAGLRPLPTPSTRTQTAPVSSTRSTASKQVSWSLSHPLLRGARARVRAHQRYGRRCRLLVRSPEGGRAILELVVLT
jgi:hypothetical protein